MKTFNFSKILIKPQSVFLIFSLLVGMLFAFITPPFQVPDEPAHIYKMYGFTEGSFNFKKAGTTPGQVLPVSMTGLAHKYGKLIGKIGNKTSKEEILQDLKTPLKKGNSAFYPHNPTAYTILSYQPGVTVLWVMKLFNVNPLWMFYVLRLCSLFVYMALMYAAIKIVPVKKWFFVLIGILPMTLYEAAGVSVDGLIIGLCLLFIAYVLRLSLDENIIKLKKRDYMGFGVLMLLITICKFAYFPLIFMYFIIPSQKFESQKTRLIYFLSIFVLNIIWIFFYLLNVSIAMQGVVSLGVSTKNKSSLDALRFIITHPIYYLKAVFYTVYMQTAQYVETLIGSLGWIDIILPVFATKSYVALLLLASFFNTQGENGKYNYDWKMKVSGLLIYLVTFVCILTSVYIIYQQLPRIDGFQGRYLLPILPLFCLFFSNKKFEFKYLPLLIVISSVFLLYVTIIVLINRFYIPI